MKKTEKTRGRKRSRFRGDLWILLIMGFLLLWVVLDHEFGSYRKIDRVLGRWGGGETETHKTLERPGETETN